MVGSKSTSTLVCVLVALACASARLAAAQLSGPVKCTTKLIRHAALPSETYASLPADVPEGHRVSGKFDNSLNRRNEVLGSVDKGTTTKLPVPGQPIQGFSGIKVLRFNNGITPTGQYLVLTDNGYGNKYNSPDSLLMFHYVTPNFKNKTVKVDRTVFLRDPNKFIPFSITNEHTKERYLTGADLDLESIQLVGSSVFIGDEFGPYLMEASTAGVVRGFWDTSVNSNLTALRSPDNMLVRLPGTPLAADLAKISYNVRRSKGFEGMAASRDGKFLYPMLEGALFDPATQDYENIGGRYYWRILKFNVAKRSFDTSFNAKYPLESKTNSLGDFNIINSINRALVIERDDGEGDPRLACSVNNVTGCFKNPAAFKRVYLVDLNKRDANGFVTKLAYIDLLDIKDPDGVAAYGTINGTFTFPFFTIENVDAVDGNSIVVGNDNNFPSSSTRVPGVNDNNEFAVLQVGSFLVGSC